jgi:hypothetical protein
MDKITIYHKDECSAGQQDQATQCGALYPPITKFSKKWLNQANTLSKTIFYSIKAIAPTHKLIENH